LLYEITGHNAARVSGWMQELKEHGTYIVDDSYRETIQDLFWADFSSDEETIARIHSVWDKYHYLLDTHTAVAMDVYEKYRNITGDNTAAVIASTASPFKFGSNVAQAVLSPKPDKTAGEFELLRALARETGLTIPKGIANLEQMPIRHNTVTSVADMEKTMLSFLK